MGKFWQYPSRTVGVCLDNFGSIRNCVATFTFAPNSLYVTKGVDVGSLATLSAKDINNFDTGTPTGLSWSGNDAGIAIALNNSTGAATAIGLSPFSIPTTITVTDPATAIIGKYDVTVVSPKIDPAQVTISLGQDTTLKLTDGQGHLVAVPAGTTTWTSSDPSKVNCITQIAGFSSCGAGNTTTFRGLAPGTVTVTATDSIAGFTTSAEMTVGDNQLYMYGVVLYAGSNGGTSPGVGSTCSTIVSSITFSGTLKPIPGQPNSYTTTWDHAGSNYGSEYLGYQPYAPNGPVNNLPVVVASNPLTIPNNFQYTESQSKMTGAISLSVPSDSGMGVILGNAMDSELPQFGTCALYWNIKGTVSRTPGP